MLYVVSHVNAHPQSLGPTLKLFVNVTSLFGCCIMPVSMVALSSGRMLTTAVDGSLATKVRNRPRRLNGNLRLRNRQSAWEGLGRGRCGGRGLGRGRSPLPTVA